MTLVLPLTFALSRPAWGWDDCGLVEGRRYLVTRAGLHLDDETVLADWGRCDLPVGAVLSLAVEEVEPPRVTLAIVPPCRADAAAWTARQVERATAYVEGRGYTAEQVDTLLLPCEPSPRVDVRF